MMTYEGSESAREIFEIHQPIPTWNHDTYQKIWYDLK